MCIEFVVSGIKLLLIGRQIETIHMKSHMKLNDGKIGVLVLAMRITDLILSVASTRSTI